MNNSSDQFQRSLLEHGQYTEERVKPSVEFPGGALAVVLLVTLPIAGIFALKNAVADLINSIPALAQFLH